MSKTPQPKCRIMFSPGGVELSPRLQWLASSLSLEARTCILNCGIVSVIEANAWDSPEQFLDACRGEHTSESALSELRALWDAAQGSCRAAVRQAILKSADPVACSPDPVVHHSHLPMGAVGGTKMPEHGTTKRRRMRAAEPDEVALHMNSLQLREKTAVESACADLWQLFLELGESGSQWKDYSSLCASDKDKFATMFFDTMCLVAITTLQSALRVMRKWKRHCGDSGISPWQPSAVHVALWLRSLREHGPTAPQGAYNTLKWLERKVGMCFHCCLPLVRDQAAVPQSHIETQATPLLLSVILGLEWLLSSQNDAVKALALTWLMLTFAVLRFAHLQRSTILEVMEHGIAARASLGKRRTQGRRRPFEWRAPRKGITNVDLGVAVHAFLKRAFVSASPQSFFLPDFLPKRCGLESATGFAGRAMSIGRFARLSQHMFQQPPFSMSQMDSSALTSYSARRVLPTIAELARFDPHELLLVGDWKSKRGGQEDLSMPMRYADQKEHTSLVVKTELPRIMRRVFQCNAQTNASWDRLSNLFPARDTSRRLAKAALLERSSALRVDQADDVRAGEQSSGSSSSDDSSSDSSSSVSTDSSEHVDSSNVQWLLSKGSRGHLHLCRPLQLQAKRCHTACNRGLCSPELGTGLDDAFSAGKD